MAQININLNIVCNSAEEALAELAKLEAAGHTATISRPTTSRNVDTGSNSDNDEVAKLRADYIAKYGKRFRMSNEVKDAIEAGEMTLADAIRSAIDGQAVASSDIPSVVPPDDGEQF